MIRDSPAIRAFQNYYVLPENRLVVKEGTDRAAVVRQHLVRSRDELFEEAVQKASKLLTLDDQGAIHPLIDVSELGNKEKVELFLLARFLANEGGLLQSSFATSAEVSTFFGIDATEVQRRAHDLKNEGKVEVGGRGKYRASPGRTRDILKDLGAA